MRIHAVVLSAAILAASCGGSSNNLGQPGQPVLVGLTITGPVTFSPDETVPYTVNGRMSDGTTQNYTTKVTWVSTNTLILTVAADGRASGKGSGDVTILASSGRFTASINVLVTPSGTFRLTGTVTESSLPVANAQVLVTAGHGSGNLTQTDSQGMYRLYGVRGDIEVTVTKAGYEPLTRGISVTKSDVLDFPDLAQVGALPSLAGTYTLTMTASPSCPTTGTTFTPPLPDYARQRTYVATIAQTGARLDVTLSGANFLIQGGKGNVFTGRVEPGDVTFVLGTPDFYYYGYYNPDYGFVEKLPNNEFLTYWGRVNAVRSPASLSGGVIGGGFMLFTGSTTARVVKGICYDGGTLTLVPQTAATRRR
ncbi:MAG TPA: hypothetical protein VJN96_00310 [Vicinamibacterales bacterium]|nr:hypothetical protein [Vicinamibacterales bacterium]